MPVFLEHFVEACRGIAETLREHPRLAWVFGLVVGVVVLALVLATL